jgi:hypothetical protein
MSVFIFLLVTVDRCYNASKSVTTSEKVTISKATLDQLIKTAGDVKVERQDSIIYKDKIVIRDHNLPVPELISDSVRFYSDHIVNADIDITINDSVQGTLIKRSFNYIPIVKVERIEITKTVPQLITVDGPAPIPKNKMQIALIGTYQGSLKALMGAEIGFINKKNVGFHYQFQTDFTGQKFHSIKFSKTFNF